MAAEQDIIKAYLVSLGFDVQPASFKRFVTALTGTDKLAVKLGGSIAGVAVAAEAMVTEFAFQMENLYYASRRTGASVANIRALQFGAQQIGLTAADASQSLEGFANALRFNPGTKGVFQMLTGHGLDADNEKNLIALLKALHNMPAYVGAQYAGMFGITPEQFVMYEQGLPDMIAAGERLSGMYKEAGIDQQAAAAAGKDYANTLRDIWSQVTLVENKMAIDLLPTFQSFASVVKEVLADLAQVNWANIDPSYLLGFIDEQLDKWGKWRNIIKEILSYLPSLGGSASNFKLGIAKKIADATGATAQHGQQGSRTSVGKIGGIPGGPPPGSLQDMADAMADKYGVPRDVFRSLIGVESTWNPLADAHKTHPESNAHGLGQLQPATAKAYGVTDAFDPAQNLRGSANYLSDMYHKFGNWRDALAAYHDGHLPAPGSSVYGNYADKILAGTSQGGDTNITLNQTNNINVKSNTGSDAKLASAIGSEVGRLTGDVIRNQAGAVQ